MSTGDATIEIGSAASGGDEILLLGITRMFFLLMGIYASVIILYTCTILLAFSYVKLFFSFFFLCIYLYFSLSIIRLLHATAFFLGEVYKYIYIR